MDVLLYTSDKANLLTFASIRVRNNVIYLRNENDTLTTCCAEEKKTRFQHKRQASLVYRENMRQWDPEYARDDDIVNTSAYKLGVVQYRNGDLASFPR